MSIRMKRQRVAVPGTSKEVGGIRPRILVYVRTGCASLRKQWWQLCKHNGILWTRVGSNPETEAVEWESDSGKPMDSAPPQEFDHDHDGWQTAYECWGPPEGLQALVSVCNWVVIRWEYVTDAPRNPSTTIGREKRPQRVKPAKPAPQGKGVFAELDELLKPYRREYAKANEL